MIHNFSFDQRHTTLLGEITISINASHPILCYIFNHYLPLFYFILYSLILSHPIPSHLLRPFLRTSYRRNNIQCFAVKSTSHLHLLFTPLIMNQDSIKVIDKNNRKLKEFSSECISFF